MHLKTVESWNIKVVSKDALFCDYLTIILRNREEYGLPKIRRYPARLRRIIVLLFNTLINKSTVLLHKSWKRSLFFNFSPLHTKLRLLQEICWLRTTKYRQRLSKKVLKRTRKYLTNLKKTLKTYFPPSQVFAVQSRDYGFWAFIEIY